MGVIQNTVRELRKNQTPSEKLFWELVRDRRFFGLKFYRQYPLKFKYRGRIRFFVADFFCFEKKLVIEIDGKIHDNQQEYDEFRMFIINQMDIKVIRFTNSEILDIGKVKEKLKEYIQ